MVIQIDSSPREWRECIRLRGYPSYQALYATLRGFASGYRSLGLRAMGDMPVMGVEVKPAEAVTRRTCAYCKTVLSRYNPGPTCFPCQERGVEAPASSVPVFISKALREPKRRSKTVTTPENVAAATAAMERLGEFILAQPAAS